MRFFSFIVIMVISDAGKDHDMVFILNLVRGAAVVTVTIFGRAGSVSRVVLLWDESLFGVIFIERAQTVCVIVKRFIIQLGVIDCFNYYFIVSVLNDYFINISNAKLNF